jgi:hypothetical protein
MQRTIACVVWIDVSVALESSQPNPVIVSNQLEIV